MLLLQLDTQLRLISQSPLRISNFDGRAGFSKDGFLRFLPTCREDVPFNGFQGELYRLGETPRRLPQLQQPDRSRELVVEVPGASSKTGLPAPIEPRLPAGEGIGDNCKISLDDNVGKTGILPFKASQRLTAS